MAQIPEHYSSQPELVAAIIEARSVQMETEDTGFAIEWLIEHYPISLQSASRALEDQTFRHPALYPEGHPGLEAIKAEQRQKGKRAYNLSKLRPQVIERDNGRCQNCGERAMGRNATLDHKDPEGPETLENLHLLCRRCNTVKGNRSWDEFQKDEEQFKARVQRAQNARSDFICKQTGLSVRGRSWKEAGCLSADLCGMARECDNGQYAEWSKEMDESVESMYEQIDKP